MHFNPILNIRTYVCRHIKDCVHLVYTNVQGYNVPLRIYHPNGIRVRLGPQYPLSVDLRGGGSFKWDREKRGPMSQQVWHDKDPFPSHRPKLWRRPKFCILEFHPKWWCLHMKDNFRVERLVTHNPICSTAVDRSFICSHVRFI